MNNEQAKAELKTHLEEFLLNEMAVKMDRAGFFNCINPEHDDRNPSMKLDPHSGNQRAKCFSCNASYDIFEAIGIHYNLSNFPQQLSKGAELYNIPQETTATHAERPKQPAEAPQHDFSSYISECHERVGETDYFKNRGISKELIERYKLGYDPQFKANGRTMQAVIIPNGKNAFTARNIDPHAPKKRRYIKQGASKPVAFQGNTEQTAPIFIVEGELDALSIATAGGNAIALGSLANIPSYVEDRKAKKQLSEDEGIAYAQRPVIIALDNDESGQEAGRKLENSLRGLKMDAYAVNPYGRYKDANEALLNDTDAFNGFIADATYKEDFLQFINEQYSARAKINNFFNGISERANFPAIPTGFKLLDKTLDGGLYAGLYVIGAISSLGKTTLALQMADQIAKNGQDVLIFSLEMAEEELIAKSISRQTYLKDPKKAKTMRDITAGARYQHYTQEEKQLIQDSAEAYAEYANHIFIHEGGLDPVGIEEIKREVQRYHERMNKPPVIIIDYLQIIAKEDDRTIDKSHIDKAVTELKKISRQYRAPVMAISSFNRDNYDQPVNLTSFKESGGIEYSADVILGLQFTEMIDDNGKVKKSFNVDEEKKKNPRRVQAKLLKNRNGETGKAINFKFNAKYNYFEEDLYQENENPNDFLKAQARKEPKEKYNFGFNLDERYTVEKDGLVVEKPLNIK